MRKSEKEITIDKCIDALSAYETAEKGLIDAVTSLAAAVIEDSGNESVVLGGISPFVPALRVENTCDDTLEIADELKVGESGCLEFLIGGEWVGINDDIRVNPEDLYEVITWRMRADAKEREGNQSC